MDTVLWGFESGFTGFHWY